MDYINTDDLVKREGEIEDILANPEEYNRDELDQLREEKSEIEEIEGYCEDFRYGAMMIPEDDFQEYAQEFANDIGAVSDSYEWPTSCIDWEEAARELAMDYSLVTYRGTDYYVR